MSTIAVLHGHGQACDRLRRAVSMDSVAGARHQVQYHREWSTLGTQINGTSATSLLIAVVDAYHSGEFAIDRITALRQMCPSVPVVVYSDLAGRAGQDVVLLAQAGVSRIITLGVDDRPSQIRDALAAADVNARLKVADFLGKLVGERMARLLIGVYDVVGEAMQAVNTGDSGDESVTRAAWNRLVHGMGVRSSSRRSLERGLARLGLPTPARTVLLFRLLHVGRLLDDPGRTVDNVAAATGFNGTLHRIVKRETRYTPKELRDAGALSRVLDSIRQSLRNGHSVPSKPSLPSGSNQIGRTAVTYASRKQLSQSASFVSLPDSLNGTGGF